jgi:hypothetical protein
MDTVTLIVLPTARDVDAAVGAIAKAYQGA